MKWSLYLYITQSFIIWINSMFWIPDMKHRVKFLETTIFCHQFWKMKNGKWWSRFSRWPPNLMSWKFGKIFVKPYGKYVDHLLCKTSFCNTWSKRKNELTWGRVGCLNVPKVRKIIVSLQNPVPYVKFIRKVLKITILRHFLRSPIPFEV